MKTVATTLLAAAALSLAACDTETTAEKTPSTKDAAQQPQQAVERPSLGALCAGDMASSPECSFAETVQIQVLEDREGMLDHGIEPSLILASFAGILPADMDGMPVAQGRMTEENGSLIFLSDGTPETSGATALTQESYSFLFKKVTQRKGVHPATAQHGYEFALTLIPAEDG